MVQFTNFNPVDSFQRGQQNKLSREISQQSINRESAAAPIRNQLDKLNLSQAQRSDKRDIASGEQKEILQKAAILNQAARAIKGLDPSQYQQAFESMAPDLQKFGVDLSRFQGVQITPEGLDQVIAETQGFLSDPNKISQMTGSNRRIKEDTEILKGATDERGQLIPVEQMTPTQKAAAIRARLIPGAGNLAQKERIALDPDLTEKVATSQSKIRSAIKQAEVEAKATGDTLTDLKRAKAALPGLKEVTNKLKTLADAATFTAGGKVIDVLAKELFGVSTEGGTARTTMTSIVDNQVLPLLRETFGAAFTKAEGDSLRATLLDVDKTPDEKKATLDAFIEQKIRNIETKEREINPQGDELNQEEQAELEQLRQLKAQQG